MFLFSFCLQFGAVAFEGAHSKHCKRHIVNVLIAMPLSRGAGGTWSSTASGGSRTNKEGTIGRPIHWHVVRHFQASSSVCRPVHHQLITSTSDLLREQARLSIICGKPTKTQQTQQRRVAHCWAMAAARSGHSHGFCSLVSATPHL